MPRFAEGSISPNKVVDFDDGHIPENFASARRASQLVRYSSFVDERIPMVHVIDEAVPSALVDALYEVTVSKPIKDDRLKPWGTYVTREQLDEYRKKYIGGSEAVLNNDSEAFHPNDRESLAVAAAAYFLDHALQQQQEQEQRQSSSSRVQTFVSPKEGAQVPKSHVWTLDDHNTVLHGVAIWALASDQGAHVPYHLDYAEQIRYESNLICPPFLAGTLQCTRISDMKGGDLAVCFGGLEHYHCHGYKGAKQQQQQQQQLIEGDKYDEKVMNNMQQDQDWITVPYRYNRMIIKSGHLPHHSTRVELLSPATKKRVIVGFNVFGHDYGPQVQLAPEHSEVFRRKVALQRALLLSNKTGNCVGINVQALQTNKGLSKLLVLAKRAKIKQELAQAQQQLDETLDDYLLTRTKNATDGDAGITVESLMKKFGTSKDGGWPSPVDVQVHINQRLGAQAQEEDEDRENLGRLTQRQKSSRLRLSLQRDPTTESMDTKRDRMVSPRDIVFLAPFQDN